MDGFRNITALADFRGTPNEPGHAPEILFLEPRQLVVNEEYQRELSRSSINMIKKMAIGWDWCSFKAPSVARTDVQDIFEVVDGQHTAIAAATNGNIPFLPCLVMSAETLEAKAAGFLGINQDRIGLTAVAIYNAKVAAKDEDAIAVECALSASGARLLAMPPSNAAFRLGDTMAVGTLMEIARRQGQARLTTLLLIAVAARAQPISSIMLKALDIAMPLAIPRDLENRVETVLIGQGCARLDIIAKSRTPHGKRTYETLADIIADLAKLPEKRMGRPPKERRKYTRAQAAA